MEIKGKTRFYKTSTWQISEDYEKIFPRVALGGIVLLFLGLPVRTYGVSRSHV